MADMKHRSVLAIAIVTTVFLLGFVVWMTPPIDAAKFRQTVFNQGVQIGNSGSDIDTMRVGQAAFSSGVLTVTAPWVTAATKIYAQRQTVAGTSGGTIAVSRTAGTNFVLTSQTAGALTTQTLDTSTVAWIAIDQPTPQPTASP